MIALDVLVKYGVGEKATSDAWGDLVRWSGAYPPVWDVVKDALKEGEDEYKSRTGKQLPAAYRSAKSVLKNALLVGVSLTSENGEPLGKSAVETAVKGCKEVVSVDKMETFRSVAIRAAAAYKRLDTEAERTAARIIMADLLGE